MNPAADGHERSPQPLKVGTKRLYGTAQAIPEAGGFQPALPLDGYPVPDPDDTKAHLEMAYELAREFIEQARISERAKERLRELDLERYQARSLRRGWGTREERETRDVYCSGLTRSFRPHRGVGPVPGEEMDARERHHGVATGSEFQTRNHP